MSESSITGEGLMTQIWSPEDFHETAQAASECQSLTAQMRSAAEMLEKFNRLYNLHASTGQWSPKALRYEADYLDRPIPGESR